MLFLEERKQIPHCCSRSSRHCNAPRRMHGHYCTAKMQENVFWRGSRTADPESGALVLSKKQVRIALLPAVLFPFFSLLLPSQDAGLGWQKTMRPGLDFHGTRSHGSLATCSQALAFNPRTLESKEGSQDCCNLKLLRTWLRIEICRYFR